MGKTVLPLRPYNSGSPCVSLPPLNLPGFLETFWDPGKCKFCIKLFTIPFPGNSQAQLHPHGGCSSEGEEQLTGISVWSSFWGSRFSFHLLPVQLCHGSASSHQPPDVTAVRGWSRASPVPWPAQHPWGSAKVHKLGLHPTSAESETLGRTQCSVLSQVLQDADAHMRIAVK